MKKVKLIVIVAICIGVIAWVCWDNSVVELNVYTVKSERLPKAFDGYRIAVVSDLHGAEVGRDNAELIELLNEAKPDIIAITGDMISSQKDVAVALKLAASAMEIAPCYYVTGNHESRVEAYSEFRRALIDLGVEVLENERITLERGGESLVLMGIVDPEFGTDAPSGNEGIVRDELDGLVGPENGFAVLMAHRPEMFEVYAENGIDVVLSGHTHGGQVRLPFIGAVVAPNQGLFPKYDAGLFSEGNTSMVISRGIGNSVIPFRINCRPEIAVVELRIK